MSHTQITPAQQSCPNHSGFTLIETMVVVALMAILAGMAAPSFTGAFQRYRVGTTADDLMASIYLARAEAIRSGQQTVIRRQTACGLTLTNARDWSCGWQVFIDLNDDKVLNNNEVLVRQVDLGQQVTVRKHNVVDPHVLSFDRYGQVTQRGQGMSISPRGQQTANLDMVCFSQGTRIRAFKNQPSSVTSCPTT